MKQLLKPYPAYKDSGLPWLGEVPEHWGTASVKRHYAIQLGKMLQNGPDNPGDVEVPYLKAQHVKWRAISISPTPTMWCSPHEIIQFGIAVGDLLVCEGGEGGRSGIVRDIPSGFIIQNALHRVRSLGECLNEYLQYVMCSVSATGWFDAINSKATIAHFTREKFGALGMPHPSHSEQSAIVRYLDYMDRRIQRYIRAKQKLIKLLEEQKQAIIHQAVTGRIDVRTGKPYPKYKPSGVEWLGEVPEHWEVRRFKSVAGVNSLLVDPRLTKYRDMILIAPNHIEREGSAILLGTETASTQGADSGKYAVRAGQIIYTKIRPYLRKAIISQTDCLCSADMYPISVHRPESMLPEFLLHIMLSVPFTQYAIDCSLRAAMPKVNREVLGDAPIWFPNRLEQEHIIEHVALAKGIVNPLMTETLQEIALLREYRTRLISDVVTGKLDVREAAANLPEEFEDVLPDDPVPDEEENEVSDTDDQIEAEE